jgi:hypothetical protein
MMCRQSQPKAITSSIKHTGEIDKRACEGGVPIETQIDVKNDSAYTEINQGSIGKISTKEIVVAQRVGDCECRARER